MTRRRTQFAWDDGNAADQALGRWLAAQRRQGASLRALLLHAIGQLDEPYGDYLDLLATGSIPAPAARRARRARRTATAMQEPMQVAAATPVRATAPPAVQEAPAPPAERHEPATPPEPAPVRETPSPDEPHPAGGTGAPGLTDTPLGPSFNLDDL